MSKKEKPFHESIVNRLKASEKRLSKNFKIGLFVSRFVTEVETIAAIIKETDIPQEYLAGLIFELENFYSEFESKYPRNENAGGGKRERSFIEKHFLTTTENLKKRLTA